MRAGKLRNKLIVQQNTPVRGSAGSLVDSWSLYINIRGERTNNVGKEMIESGKITGERGVTYITRYHSGITNKMRIIDGSETLEIVDVDDFKKLNRKLIITCIQVT